MSYLFLFLLVTLSLVFQYVGPWGTLAFCLFAVWLVYRLILKIISDVASAVR